MPRKPNTTTQVKNFQQAIAKACSVAKDALNTSEGKVLIDALDSIASASKDKTSKELLSQIVTSMREKAKRKISGEISIRVTLDQLEATESSESSSDAFEREQVMTTTIKNIVLTTTEEDKIKEAIKSSLRRNDFTDINFRSIDIVDVDVSVDDDEA